MRINRNCIFWLDRGFYPPFIGFCPNEKAWTAVCKDMGLEYAWPTSDGSTTRFPKTNKLRPRSLIILVTIGDRMDKTTKRDPYGFSALVAHEVVHVWQMIKEDIGEDNPGDEQEAYAVQCIFKEVIWAYAKTRKNILSAFRT